MSTSDNEPRGGWQELPAEKEERSWAPRLIVAGLALLAASIFIAQNSERVETKFLFFDGEPRLFNVILVSMLLGAALGQVVPILWRRRKDRKKKAKRSAQPDVPPATG